MKIYFASNNPGTAGQEIIDKAHKWRRQAVFSRLLSFWQIRQANMECHDLFDWIKHENLLGNVD